MIFSNGGLYIDLELRARSRDVRMSIPKLGEHIFYFRISSTIDVMHSIKKDLSVLLIVLIKFSSAFTSRQAVYELTCLLIISLNCCFLCISTF